MRFLKVVKPGFLTSIQDLGRKGFAGSGVSEAGAADPYSLRIGNLLVRNPAGAAGLEMTLLGSTFEVLSDAVIAITGSDFGAEIDGQTIPMRLSMQVRRGQTLSFGATKSGARCYLCVSGGIDAPVVMGSRSTHLLTEIGGLEGRALQTDDIVHACESSLNGNSLVERKVDQEVIPDYKSLCKLRVILGPEDNYFEKESLETFLSSDYLVAESSDRVGLRLDGPSLKHSRGAHILSEGCFASEGITTGAVQVPANGLPIILFVEHPTTGGYPKIAAVVSADLHRIGQLKPRDKVQFQAISLEKAIDLLRAQEKILSAVASFI